jgi:hypothetical protein
MHPYGVTESCTESIRLSELWENRVLLSELWEPRRNYGKIAFLLSELWEPIRRNYGNLLFSREHGVLRRL